MPFKDPDKYKQYHDAYRIGYNVNYHNRLQTDIDFLLARANNFWEHVKKGSPDQCWPYKGRTILSNKGFPSETRYGLWINLTAHRAAIEIDTAKLVPPDMVAKACVRNSLCCNPAHLSVVTRTESLGSRKYRNPP